MRFYAYAPRGYLRRLAGIFAAFAEELIEGVEKCCQRFPGASRCNHQRMFASRRHMPGLRLDSGRLFKGAKKPVAGRR
ncbi:TPA: hypothetical protein LSG99_000612 [Escherichia coli]|nr:hypothetical protein [Escherichia coli]EJC8139810.1 hypothetical protein [Escherichia coli]ELP8831022.1 hypothetical protein [Escherichia coli]MCX1238319.1 hypothetical protein [Escherichia coli]HAI6401251.1 hypothetical protein [Escherichia coli]